ncbi:MAG: sulfotransferase family protein [Polyangiales bacterium]
MLSLDTLLEEARAQTGLDDFGDDAFREPLRVLVDSANQIGPSEELREVIRRSLINRLQIEASFRAHPEIERVEIERPLFVAGLPRSGTTVLQQLCAQDPHARALAMWELLWPAPPPDPAHREDDPRIARAEEFLRADYAKAPEFLLVHERTARGPGHCHWLFGQTFVDKIVYSAPLTGPDYQRYISSIDVVPAYRYYRRELQLLTWKCRNDHLVLKDARHSEDLGAVLTVFPDAQVIVPHRDPVKVAASFCSLLQVRSVASGKPADPKTLGPRALGRLESSIAGLLAARQKASERARIVDIAYADLMKDPVGTLRRTYEVFGYPFSEAYAERIRGYLRENPQHKHGVHKYSLEQYGLDAREIRERFRGYRERFAIPDE